MWVPYFESLSKIKIESRRNFVLERGCDPMFYRHRYSQAMAWPCSLLKQGQRCKDPAADSSLTRHENRSGNSVAPGDAVIFTWRMLLGC